MKLNLNLQEVTESSGGDDLLEPGEYTAKVVDTSLHETGNGHGLRVTFQVMAGDSEGCRFSTFLNIVNSNPMAQRIALSDLKRIMTVGDHPNPGGLADSEELHGLCMRCTLTQVPNHKDPQYTDNKVKRFSAIQKITEHKSLGAMATRKDENHQAPTASRAKLPWE